MFICFLPIVLSPSCFLNNKNSRQPNTSVEILTLIQLFRGLVFLKRKWHKILFFRKSRILYKNVPYPIIKLFASSPNIHGLHIRGHRTAPLRPVSPRTSRELWTLSMALSSINCLCAQGNCAEKGILEESSLFKSSYFKM